MSQAKQKHEFLSLSQFFQKTFETLFSKNIVITKLHLKGKECLLSMHKSALDR